MKRIWLGFLQERVGSKPHLKHLRHDSGGDGDELDRPIPPVPRPQPNAVAVLMDDDPEAVVLQLVNPAVARSHLLGEDRLSKGG